MGNKIAGVDVLLKIKNGQGQSVVLGGQTGATLNRGAETIDVTDKTSGGYTASIAGLLSWSVDCDGFVELGDEGLEQIEEAFTARKPVEVEARVGATDETAGVTYTGSGYIVDLPLDFGQDAAVTYSLSIEGASPLKRIKGVAPKTASDLAGAVPTKDTTKAKAV